MPQLDADNSFRPAASLVSRCPLKGRAGVPASAMGENALFGRFEPPRARRQKGVAPR